MTSEVSAGLCMFPPAYACVVGLPTAIMAASGATGAAVLKAAGWTSAGVAVKTAATHAALGTATVWGALGCCIVPCILAAGGDDDSKKASSGGGLAGLAISGALYSTVGGAMLGARGVELGFTAASGAVGAPIVMTGVGVIIVGGACFAMCCSAAANEEGTLDDASELRVVDVTDRVKGAGQINIKDIEANAQQKGTMPMKTFCKQLVKLGHNALALQLPQVASDLKSMTKQEPQQNNLSDPEAMATASMVR